MSRRPPVPGLSDDWAEHQLDLLETITAAAAAVEATPYQPSPPVCASCTVAEVLPGGPAYQCDPDRPGCPLHDVPEQTREQQWCQCGHRWEDHHERDGCGGCALAFTRSCKRWPEQTREACGEPLCAGIGRCRVQRCQGRTR